jgi:hypothetical protein
MPKATCKETGQTVLSNDIGKKFAMSQQRDAQFESERLAAKMTAKTGQSWSGFVESYVVDDQGRTRL